MSIGMSVEGHSRLLWAMPADIFDLISFRLSGGSILDLWCTGDGKLQHLMSHNGVRVVDFYDTELGTKSRFPHCLRFFRGLKSLSLDRGNFPLDRIDIIQNGLQSLSPTLEKLVLKFSFADSLLLDSVVLSAVPIKVKRKDQPVMAVNTPSRLWPISTYLPNLKFLVVQSITRPTGLCDRDIGDLPDSLTELHLLLPKSKLTIGLLAYLKPSIMRLSISLNNIDGMPNLVIPPTLQFLSLPGSVWHTDWNALIPPTLTELDVFRLEGEIDLNSLPRAFQSLSLRSDGEEPMQGQIADHITSLSLEITPWKGIILEKLIPKQLRSLTCTSGLQLSKLAWPASLTFLDWSTEEFQRLIPKPKKGGKKTDITASNAYKTKNPADNPLTKALGNLPKTLRALNLSLDGEGTAEIVWPFQFPFMTSLLISGTFFASESLFQGLSPNLISLSLESNDTGLPSELKNDFFALLPRTLTDLTLFLKIEASVTPICFVHLPKYLRTLKLDIQGNLTANDFRVLPRSLTCLVLSKIRTMAFDAMYEVPRGVLELMIARVTSKIDIFNLPPKLRLLRATDSQTPLSAADITALPRQLTQLYMPKATLPPNAANLDWPFTLRSYLVANFHLRGQPKRFSDQLEAFSDSVLSSLTYKSE